MVTKQRRWAMEIVRRDAGCGVLGARCCWSSRRRNGDLEAMTIGSRAVAAVVRWCKLDTRAKLCIRNSLYRLARSAEQRHNFCETNSSSRVRRGRNGTLAAGESNKCLGYMDPEPDTNPIECSIAQLLFYRPSRSSARPSNDALSLESQGIIHGSMTTLPVHNQLVCQEDIACDADMKVPITEQKQDFVILTAASRPL